MLETWQGSTAGWRSHLRAARAAGAVGTDDQHVASPPKGLDRVGVGFRARRTRETSTLMTTSAGGSSRGRASLPSLGWG